MKLDLIEKANHHTEICTCCAWTGGELYTCSDDKTILKWSQDGDMIGTIATVDAYITSIAWAPDSRMTQRSSVFAVSCADGTIRFFSMSSPNSAREDKKVSAHTGATISVKWSGDGSALISAGEDGDLKVWSKSGNLRSTLTQNASAVHTFVWGPDGDCVLWGAKKTLNLKSQSGSGRKALSWAAHDELVTCVDWNKINDLVVSTGEDCVYKVWDSFGRQLYCSPQNSHVLTSISWCPNGGCFAVGSFNSIRLCDKTGWSHSRERPKCGSIMSMAWTNDGTEVAGAGGSGSVVFAQLVERKVEWQNYEAVLIDPKLILVTDANSDAYERLEFPRDRVVEFALGWDHLIVSTTTQCFIYSVYNWNTPHIFDIRNTVQLIVLAQSYFLMMDSNALTIYNFEGRVISSPKFNGFMPQVLNKSTVALCDDCVVILDRSDSKTIRCFDLQTGRLAGSITHKAEIAILAISQSSQSGGVTERRVSLVDRNRDLFLAPVVPQPGIFRGTYKLQTQVDTVAWCDSTDMLCAIADSRFIVWYYPNVVFVDRDLLAATTETVDGSNLGKSPFVSNFCGNRATVRKGDGSQVVITVSRYVAMLQGLCREKRWNESIRLCRFVKDAASQPQLWSVLAAMAIQGRHLESVQIALAALVEVGKLEYMEHVSEKVYSEEGKAAAIALYRRCPDEAEAILLQAKPPLLYRAIKMNIRLFRWNRAMEIALKNKKHVDTVLGYRARYLERFGKVETNAKFLQYSKEFPVDWETIKAKISNEKEDERARSGLPPSSDSK